MKKLTLNQGKCFNLHVGKNHSNFPELKVHGESMTESSNIKYLGDWINCQIDNKKNIESRVNQGISTVSQITSILKQVSLGFFYVEIGLILRDSMLTSKLLFNAEVWLRVRKEQIKKLTSIDEMFLIRILGLKQTVGRECIYLETGKYPLASQIQQRRLMYYWHLLKKDPNELIVRVLKAQKLETERHDWYELIQSDKKELQINLSDEQISCLTKVKFKQFITEKINAKLRLELEQKRKSHTKSKYMGLVKSPKVPFVN